MGPSPRVPSPLLPSGWRWGVPGGGGVSAPDTETRPTSARATTTPPLVRASTAAAPAARSHHATRNRCVGDEGREDTRRGTEGGGGEKEGWNDGGREEHQARKRRGLTHDVRMAGRQNDLRNLVR